MTALDCVCVNCGVSLKDAALTDICIPCALEAIHARPIRPRRRSSRRNRPDPPAIVVEAPSNAATGPDLRAAVVAAREAEVREACRALRAERAKREPVAPVRPGPRYCPDPPGPDAISLAEEVRAARRREADRKTWPKEITTPAAVVARVAKLGRHRPTGHQQRSFTNHTPRPEN